MPAVSFWKDKDFKDKRIDYGIGQHKTMPKDWSGEPSSMTVADGYQVCMYEKPYLQMKKSDRQPFCVKKGDYNNFRYLRDNGGDWNDRVESLTVKKDCDHPGWMWDKDCIANSENSIGSCLGKASKCHGNRLAHCNNSSVPSDKCLNFCNDNQGSCDALMRKFCDIPANKDSSICSCLNSPATKYNPVCIDSKCVRNGYQTSSMLTQKCPAITDCSIYYDIKDTGKSISFKDASIEQRCGNSNSGSNTKPTGTASENNEEGWTVWLLRNLLWMIVIVIVAAVIIGGSIWVVKRWRGTGNAPIKVNMTHK